MIQARPIHEKSALLEAAYEEYCRCQGSSQRVDVEQFLERYSTIRSSLRRQIQVHDFLADRSDLVELCHDAPWPLIGDTVFEFTILEELGRGAFARVYLCLQAGIGQRQVVVKFAAEGAYEADTLGRLSHPNIMPVHSVQHDEDGARSAICMPFRGRSTLCDLIDRAFAQPIVPPSGEVVLRVARENIELGDRCDDCGPPDAVLARASYVDAVVHLGIQLAEAISHAHARGVRHGDLKPSNILLTSAGRPMLLDFNLAVREAGTRTPGGTMPYMSPEQLAEFEGFETDGLVVGEHRPNRVDHQADVFSLAVILYELLSGSLPFGELPSARPAQERAAILAAAQQHGPRPLCALNPAVDQPLADLIERSLSVDKARRPPSASALAEELQGRSRLSQRSCRFVGRHKILVAGAVLLTVLLAGSFGTYLYLRDPYPVRQYKLALADFDEGRLGPAMTRLNPLIAASPLDFDALYLRGITLMQMKQYDAAIIDLEAARRIKADVRIQVVQAYCLCRLKYYKEARFLYTKAMDAGYDRIDALNNLAHCYSKEQKYAESMKLLQSAAVIEPSSPQVFLNSAMVGLAANANHEDSRWEDTVDDAKRLLELSPINAHLELLAARIFAWAGVANPTLLEESLLHLETACRRGLPEDKKSLVESRAFVPLVSNSRFQDAIRTASASNTDSPPDPLIEPDTRTLLAIR